MMRIGRSSVALLALFAVCALAARDADVALVHGMQSLSITCNTHAKLDLVRRHEHEDGFDFVHLPRKPGYPFLVYVTPAKVGPFKAELKAHDIEFKVIAKDVSKLIEEERIQQFQDGMLRAGFEEGLSFKSYPRYTEIKEYLDRLGQTHKDILKTFSLGTSFEGRDIMAVKFSTGGTRKPALLIDAGIHAREWIAPTTALYAIKELAENPANRYIFQNIDIYIVPLLNPDGYEFTHYNETTRMWRKTRSEIPDSECLGVDANRNFDYYWNTSGSSSNPCNVLYAGHRPFSEPETRALRDFVLARRDRIKAYLSFHSFGGYFLHPWGYAKIRPINAPVLTCAANAAVNELTKFRGTKYTIGSSATVLYAAAGGSDDWAMGVAGIDVAYTVELPGNYKYGFFPPTSEIIPVGQETFEAIKVFAQFVNREVCLWV